MKEHYIVAADLGQKHLDYKIAALKEAGYKIVSITENADIPMAGSTSTPYSSTWGKTEKGWRIEVER